MGLLNTFQSKLLFQKMLHTQTKQAVAADNMARSSVGGENEKKLESFKGLVNNHQNQGSPVRTNVNHMQSKSRADNFKIKSTKGGSEVQISGNNINPEEQLLQLNEAATEFYRLGKVFQGEKNRIKTILGFGIGRR